MFEAFSSHDTLCICILFIVLASALSVACASPFSDDDCAGEEEPPSLFSALFALLLLLAFTQQPQRVWLEIKSMLFAPFGTCVCLVAAAFVLQLFKSPSGTFSFSGASHCVSMHVSLLL